MQPQPTLTLTTPELLRVARNMDVDNALLQIIDYTAASIRTVILSETPENALIQIAKILDRIDGTEQPTLAIN